MPEAQGKVLDMQGTEAIRSDWLETIPYSGGEQMIRYETPEFSAVCPFSGLPDARSIWLTRNLNRF